MKVQIVEQVELFTEAELESLEFTPEEIEAIEQERVPNLDSITYEDIAEGLEAYFERGVEAVEALPREMQDRILDFRRVASLEDRIRSLWREIDRDEDRLRRLNRQLAPRQIVIRMVDDINRKKRERDRLQRALNELRQFLRNRG